MDPAFFCPTDRKTHQTGGLVGGYSRRMPRSSIQGIVGLTREQVKAHARPVFFMPYGHKKHQAEGLVGSLTKDTAVRNLLDLRLGKIYKSKSKYVNRRC